ncbi:helix-turn-helix, AraC type, partial [Pseudomonas syringae pv. pisi str. 1704B]
MPTLTLRLGDLSVGFIQSLTDAVNSFDRNPDALLKQYGLDPIRLSQARARLS